MSEPIKNVLSRRNLLVRGGSAALVTATLSGCGFLSTEPERDGGDSNGGGSVDTSVKESPMLAERVEAGDLEPLAERLPKEPLVVEVAELGSYGGTWRSFTQGPGDTAAFQRIAGYEPLLRKDPMVTQNLPGVATAVEASDDATTFTIRLREGLRWSDGEPLTADDLMFVVQDVAGNPDLNPTPPKWLSQDGKLAQAEKVDDYTVKLTFAQPNGLFLDLATHYIDLVAAPKHYASRFHPKYNDKAEQEAKDAGFETWTDYYDGQVNEWESVDCPVLNAWKVTTPLGEGNSVELERNPYYWKTDPEGRQLPYIDKLSYAVVMDPEVMVLKTTSGEVDLMYRHVNVPANKPVFAKSREESGYQISDLTPTSMNTMCVALNLANKNKDHRELYQNKDFRIGLSHAIDRQELITAVWQRQGEPWQAAPTKNSIYYDEEFAKQYTEFDVDTANEHLDKAGIAARDGDGFRTLPNGKNLTITLDVAQAMFSEWSAAAAIIKNMWKAVGIRLNVNAIDRTLFSERVGNEANETDACVWSGDGGAAVEIVEPRWYFPFSSQSFWATPWAEYFASDGASGEKPIDAALQQMELYWQLEKTPDQKAREDLYRQIIAIAKEQFWVIGIASAPAPYVVINNRLKNVQTPIPDTPVYYTPAHANPPTWFIQE
ncbi:ABC transporter substrate-binding protein [Microlunatus parietis]|uniref:Peptide/nickel transport system substrate-binding protein n=1 Tax=Microlunatus parietis TaxID=682979 RepID=A0A7Y9ICC7_9ACTN|nr:ABC transporter substrate-binding protein [Microlunatus parietis]NYE74313.1 peptide/nickel transport system substrate-binding protein [Microlunatus parietis]